MSKQKDLSQMRENYTLDSIDSTSLDPNPFVQFEDWLQQAIDAEIKEPNAMILGTANCDGAPSLRTVLLKGMQDEGMIFYTNYGSHKAQEMESNNKVSVLFLWKQLHRQVRIVGKVERLSREASVAYHRVRPRGSQMGALVSAQSSVIEDRSVLEEKMRELQAEYGDDKDIPCPEHWGGYLIKPESYEFWQGRSSRLHDRILYKQGDGAWVKSRLAP